MSENDLSPKKGKGFKEIIEEKQKKDRTLRKLIKMITSFDSSVIYCFFFLLFFAMSGFVFYYLVLPDVFLWGIFLLITAFVWSIVAHHLTKAIKKRQWRYAHY